MRTASEAAMKLPGVQQLIAQEVLKEWAKEIISECSNIVREYPEDALVQIQNLVYEI